MVVRQDEALLVDDEAGARGLDHLLARLARPALSLALIVGIPEEAAEQVVAAEELGEVLRALARLGPDVDDGRRRGLGDVAERLGA